MKHEEIIKKIDFADECNKEVAGNFGRTMNITMEEAFLFKQLLEQQANESDTGNDKCHIQNVTHSAYQLCPKCNGQGIVSKPPWVAGDVYEWSSTQTQFTCDVCNGAKIIPQHCG